MDPSHAFGVGKLSKAYSRGTDRREYSVMGQIRRQFGWWGLPIGRS